MAADTTLLQFAREPVPGRVKTRMLSQLTAQEACALHCELVLWTCDQLLRASCGRVELKVAGSTAAPLFARCAALGVDAVDEQVGGDLGERMLYALDESLPRARRVILVGSDCPAITPDYIAQAERALDAADVVIGPAADGGFVLIGVARAVTHAMFDAVAWGGSSVYTRTTTNLNRLGVRWSALPVLHDIDRPQDLRHWQALKALGN